MAWAADRNRVSASSSSSERVSRRCMAAMADLDSMRTGRCLGGTRGILRRAPEAGGGGGRVQRRDGQAGAREFGLVPAGRRHVVRAVRVKQRGQQLDLPPAGPELG